MAKREECRKCGAKLRHDKTSEQYDPEYCSGLCRRKDGSEPYVKTAEEQAMVVKEAKLIAPASFKDYEKNVGGRYVRRFEPEKLNWGEPMSDHDLLQAGFRANREPIDGDWDYQEMSKEQRYPLGSRRINKDGRPETYMKMVATKKPNEWQLLKAKAKELGIQTHGKKKEQIETEIKEAENA